MDYISCFAILCGYMLIVCGLFQFSCNLHKIKDFVIAIIMIVLGMMMSLCMEAFKN